MPRSPNQVLAELEAVIERTSGPGNTIQIVCMIRVGDQLSIRDNSNEDDIGEVNAELAARLFIEMFKK